MSKNAILGIAAAACLVAAGVGAFFATRPSKAAVSAPEPAVSVAAQPVQPAATGQFPLPAGTDGVIAEQPAATAATNLPPATGVEPAPATAPAPTATTSKPAGRSGGTTPARKPAGTAQPGPAPATRETVPGGLEKPWPSGAATAEPQVPATPPAPVEQPAPPVEQAPLPPPEPKFDELVVARDSVLGIKLDGGVTSETARLEDPVEARVTRDVRVGSRVAIPVGARVLGSVTRVDQGGKMKNKSFLGVRFHTLVLADGTRVPIQSDEIYREGDSPGQEAASKMGAAAAGGAILGAILGGGKGAAIGGSIGAAGGAAAVMAGKRNPAILQAGAAITVRLLQPVSIVVER